MPVAPVLGAGPTVGQIGTMTGAFDDITTANRAHVNSFEWADLGPVPSRGLAVVTCMDTRLDPLKVLGLQPGQAHIVRIAAGRCGPDVVDSLHRSHSMGVDRIAVIRHTDCKAAGADPSADLLADVAMLREDPDLAGATIGAFVYDTATGALSPEGDPV